MGEGQGGGGDGGGREKRTRGQCSSNGILLHVFLN